MVSNLKTDVLVVGAGPAGSMAAKWAAKSGAKVLMIEKRQEIGSPVRCGEGMSKDWLKEVGIAPSQRWINLEVEGARIYSPSEKVFEINEKHAGNEVGYVVERDAFDKQLAIDAANAGVDVLLKTAATGVLKENGKVTGVKAKAFGEPFEIQAKVTIGADGFESQVGRWAGIPTNLMTKDMDTCIQYRMTNVDCDTRYCDFYLGKVAPGGYVWIFPKADGLANVGIGVQLSKVTEMAAPRVLLDDWISKHPAYAKGKKIDVVGGGVSIAPPLKQTVTDGMMLVGDAARVIDPLTGGGIANGCIAGKICGEVAAQAVDAGTPSKEFFQAYEKGWRARLEEKLYRNWLAKEKLCSVSDETFDKVIDALHDVKLQKLNVHNILKAVRDKYPEVTRDFESFLEEPRMPGAPNRPPEIDAPPAPVAVVPEDPAKRVLRRLGPARIALRLDLWKGAPAKELAEPLARADARYASGDIANAQSDLDQLAVRFAEPRWPTMPVPFKLLRVAIPAPMPPAWDPDFTLAPADREAKRIRREAELQRDLAEASVLWAAAHQFPIPDGTGRVERAKAALASPGVSDAFWTEIDAIWESVRSVVPMPTTSGAPAAAAATEAA